MIIYKFVSDISAALELYNEISNEKEILFKKLDLNEFKDIFLVENSVHIMAFENGLPVGFVSGNTDSIRRCGYVAYIGVKKEKRRQKVGSTLMNMMIDSLVSSGVAKKVECVFFCPSHLPWYIPGHFPHDHPCAPGVDASSVAYNFFLKLGFFEWTAQNSYYLNLCEFYIPENVRRLTDRLSDESIEITLYDPKSHKGLYELFINIGNMSWCDYVMKSIEKPISVAVDRKADGLVVAYTGPIDTQPSGRGNFCGIGTHKEYRGRGIGKAVFFHMCEEQKKRGSTFMSLYTGKENPARHIYESAGFKIVHEWANMRLEF